LAFPGEELHVSGAIPVRTVITALATVPALPVILSWFSGKWTFADFIEVVRFKQTW